MSEIKDIFYNIFWQNKACQNLFLLSKVELLDTRSVTIIDNTPISVTFPRIIISNVEKQDDSHEIIKLRTEGSLIKSESSINKKVEKYTPLITNFIESKFGKSLERFSLEFGANPGNITKFVIRFLIANEDKKEGLIIHELQKFGFIGKQINTFIELENYFKKEFFTKNIHEIFSEENTWNFYELLKSLKDIYTNETYKNLYETNQVLVNSLFDSDNFSDRLKLFSHLYEAEIISPSREDAIVECTSCSPGAYHGVLQLKVNPLKLKDFKCPICQKPLNFYVPYELHLEIFNIIKSKDGLLLDALCNLLSKNKIEFQVNQTFLNDIEIDCIFYTSDKTIYMVECKMYKINTTRDKLKSKIKEHYAKLVRDINRLKDTAFKGKVIIPVLLVNVTLPTIVDEAKNEINYNQIDDSERSVRICAINEISTIIGG